MTQTLIDRSEPTSDIPSPYEWVPMILEPGQQPPPSGPKFMKGVTAHTDDRLLASIVTEYRWYQQWSLAGSLELSCGQKGGSYLRDSNRNYSRAARRNLINVQRGISIVLAPVGWMGNRELRTSVDGFCHAYRCSSDEVTGRLVLNLRFN
jgi:hypothetical protein